MAKKNTSRPKTISTRASGRGTSRPAGASAPIHSAADMSTHAAGVHEAAAPDGPTYDEIADAAYHRYLRRGGQHGADFDDWVEAEPELRSRLAN